MLIVIENFFSRYLELLIFSLCRLLCDIIEQVQQLVAGRLRDTLEPFHLANCQHTVEAALHEDVEKSSSKIQDIEEGHVIIPRMTKVDRMSQEIRDRAGH